MRALHPFLLILFAALLWCPAAVAGDAESESDEPSGDEPDGDAPPADAPPADAPPAEAPPAEAPPADAAAPAAVPAETVPSPDAPVTEPAPATPVEPAFDPWDASAKPADAVPPPPVEAAPKAPAGRSATKPSPGIDPYQSTRDKAARELLAFRAKRTVPKYLVVFLGGSSVSVFDEGLLRWQDADSIPQFSWGVDLFLHERIGVALSGTASGSRSTEASGEDSTSSVSLSLRTGSLELAAKAVITPPYWPVRTYGRAGAGVRAAALGLEGGVRDDRLARRWHSGAAGYGVVGLGIEVTSPRIWSEIEVPWGVGLRVEAGAEIGGGGTTPLAPSVDLGTAGRVDLGPLYVDVGLVLLF